MNIEDLKKFKKYNPDLKIRELKNGDTTVYIIYFETLCKSNTINDFILKPIYDDKKIAIVFHSTAMLFLLMTWCKVIPSKEDFSYKFLFNDEEVFNDKIDYCEIFKLTFDDENLIDIKNIRG